MKKIMELFLSFTHKSYSVRYKLLSLLPGSVVFLVLSPLMLFLFSRYLTGFIPVTFARSLEITLAGAALFLALILMSWATLSLWITGRGTPAPITPTRNLVTTGLYGHVRNPIELGTNLYFFFLGTWFDGLLTGLFCMVMGLILGYGYIKIIEEQELALRFGSRYERYRAMIPMFLPLLGAGKDGRHD